MIKTSVSIVKVKSLLVMVLFGLLAFSLSGKAQTRKKVEILHCDVLDFNPKIIANAQRLLGNVNITVDGAIMWCDSMYSYTNNSVDAFGKVHIVRGDTLNMYADFIHYNPETKLAKARRNVKLIDKQMTLTTDSLDYSMSNDLASYSYSGTVKDSANILTSLIGQYYVNEKKAYFKTKVDGVTKDYKIKSDTLIYFTNTKKVFIEGATLIFNEKDTLYAEYGWYDSVNGYARLLKNPRIWNAKQKVKADSIFYDKLNGEGLAMGHARIQDIENSIIVLGNRVQYNDLTKMASATDMAVLIQYSKTDTLYLHADRLLTMPDSPDFNKALAAKMTVNTAFSDSLPGWALSKNTFINEMLATDTLDIHTMVTKKLISEILAKDTVTTAKLVPDIAETKLLSSVKQTPSTLDADTMKAVSQIPKPEKRVKETSTSDSLKRDTLGTYPKTTGTLTNTTLTNSKIAADTLAIIDNKNTRRVLAWYNVRYFRKDVQGKCDSLVYWSKDSTIQMYTQPIIWSDKNQISANYIEMINRKKEPDEIRMKENAFIIAMEDDSLRFNQIKGKNMTGYVRNNELQKINVDGNGQSNYYARDKSGIIGLNKAESSNITIYMNKGKVKRIVFIKSPDGELKPIGELGDGDKLLPGFNWQAEIRPKNKEDIFRRPDTEPVSPETKTKTKNPLIPDKKLKPVMPENNQAK